MITLKMNTYNKKEMERMADLLANMEIHMSANYCKNNNCRECVYRHLCYDITSAKEYVIKELNKPENKNR